MVPSVVQHIKPSYKYQNISWHYLWFLLGIIRCLEEVSFNFHTAVDPPNEFPHATDLSCYSTVARGTTLWGFKPLLLAKVCFVAWHTSCSGEQLVCLEEIPPWVTGPAPVSSLSLYSLTSSLGEKVGHSTFLLFELTCLFPLLSHPLLLLPLWRAPFLKRMCARIALYSQWHLSWSGLIVHLTV